MPNGNAPTAPPVDMAGFRRAVLDLGLVSDEDFDRHAGAENVDVSRLAKSLVTAKRLTSYQAGVLLQGRARGLRVGPYLVLDKLGQGGMGVVFRAKHHDGGPPVALKVLLPSFSKDSEAVLRFRREFEIAARLGHPNVVAALDASEDRGVQYLTMEFVEGRDLDAVVRELGPLPVKMSIHCVVQAARGLDAAHAQDIIHRDVKPANLMLTPSGVVRVLDLGLARVIEAANPLGKASGASLTQSGSYMGTVDYIAPEQADDSKRATHKADIYALGCTLYFLLTGRPPFEGDTLLKRLMAHQQQPAPSLYAAREDIPAALEAAYQTMMAKRPGDRPRSMAEVIALLEACRSSADEAKQADAGLRSFAETVMKRASPRKRGWGVDASVYARPSETPRLQFDPDLKLEDLVMDFREEVHAQPLAEEKLPPLVPDPLKRTPRRRRATVPFSLLGLGLIGGVVWFGFLSRSESNQPKPPSPAPMPPDVARERPGPSIQAQAADPRVSIGVDPKGKPMYPVSVPLMNGDIWECTTLNPDSWQVRDGSLYCDRNDVYNSGLTSRFPCKDFDLKFRLKPPPGSYVAIVFRSVRGVVGPVYESNEPDRGTLRYRDDILQSAPEGVIASLLRPGEFNDFAVRCVGKHAKITFNGRVVIEGDYPDFPDSGLISFWPIAGDKAEYKDFSLINLDNTPRY